MTRSVIAAWLTAVLVPSAAAAQLLRPRSTEYLFVATADDARALWLNPAGLHVITEASVMAEFVLERPVVGDIRLAQWTAGFNSRGFSFGYQRDRFVDADASDAFRFGLGLRFRGGAVGTALTFYRSPGFTQRGLDLGLRYRPLPAVDLGVVLRHIGRPTIRDGNQLPVTAVLGASWMPVPAHLQLASEALIVEQLGDSGFDIWYRAGARISTSGGFPLGILFAADFSSTMRVDRWTVGIALGGNDQGLALGSAADGPAGQRLETVSVTGVASRRVPGRQF